MDFVLKIVKYVTENYQLIITSVIGILSGIIAICMIIPGEQPEKFLQGIVDFLKKFSAKKE